MVVDIRWLTLAVDTVLFSTSTFVSALLDGALSKLRRELPHEWMKLVEERISATRSLFTGLSTSYLQQKYFKENFHLVEPVPVQLGSRLIWKKSRQRRKVTRVHNTMYYVPLLESLSALLNKPDVREEVETHHCSTDGVLRDFCDGLYVKQLPGVDNNTLLLALYYDELEVVNPLGSRRGKHKLGMFYWMLLNIHPAHRSTLRTIQLLAVVKAKHIKQHGMDTVLKPVIKDLKTLGETGITVDCSGGVKQVKGYLLVFLGDTPAAGLVGGFKEGVGGAYRCCRACMVKSSDLSLQLKCAGLRLRNLKQHLRHCDLVSSDTVFSKEYGVNRLSSLNDAPKFDLCRCIPHDMMHIVLEGILPHHLKLLLQHCILTAKYFSLQYLNTQINSFSYGYTESMNAPRPVDKDRLLSDQKIVQTASQMWLLGRLLPLFVGGQIPDDDPHWICYIELLMIMVMSTAVEVSQNTVSTLTFTIEGYLFHFNQLYPNKMTPKMHYLLHFPEQMRQFGPLRHQWCMRLEAKNAHIKQLVGKNFKNLPKTIAERHQRYMCLQLLSVPGTTSTNYLYSGDSIGKVETLPFDSFHPIGIRETVAESFPHNAHLPFATSVTSLGHEFRVGAVVCLRRPCDSEYPLFGEIIHIAVQHDVKFLVVNSLSTCDFSHHFFAYSVVRTEDYQVVEISKLALHQVLHKYNVMSSIFVAVRSCDHVELFV